MYLFLGKHQIFYDNQFGFRSGRSVVDQLLITNNDTTLGYDSGATVDFILFDFIKAFDLVHHETLKNKLRTIDISGNLLGWIMRFL